MVSGFSSFDSSGMMIRSGRDAVGENGMVSTGKYDATKAGLDILKKGGNAIDAAVAAGFALGVCEPNASGLGGGGFMTLRLGGTGKSTFIDFREIAPKLASPEMWEIDDNEEVLDNENLFGGKAVGVPGEVAGLIYALLHYGTMSLEEVMEPAIKIAFDGYIVTPQLSYDIGSCRKELLRYGTGAAIYLKGNRPYKAGDIIRNPELAVTLSKIAKGGKEVFYKGEIAERIINSVKSANGVMTMEDLAGYEVREREPVKGSYRGYEIISSPAPSSGGTHIIQILNMLENFNIADMEVNSPDYIHLFSEIFKLCYQDKAEYMGDKDFVPIPSGGLLSKEYARKQAAIIDMKRASVYAGCDPWLYEHGDTTHYSIADKDGNMVAVTKTLDHFFGSCVAVQGTGIVLNNQMSDFHPGAGKPNSIEPGKKPLSSMSPTLLLKGGRPFMILGSPGGEKIISTVSQVISKVIDHSFELQAAVESPRISDNTENRILFESRISEQVMDKLRAMGHETLKLNEWDRQMGAVQAVGFGSSGMMLGAADPRRDGKALGF
ncbi:MAG: gamma-glutamyltransferase [Pseudomonadota bacterium]